MNSKKKEIRFTFMNESKFTFEAPSIKKTQEPKGMERRYTFALMA